MDKMTQNSLFSGVFAASLTPIDNELRCNCKELASHSQDLINRGCQGVVLFGTTGEGPSFSVDERLDALKKVIELGVDPQKLIFGISCSSIPDAVKLAKAACDKNCLAVLMAPPFFYKKFEEVGIVAFYREVIQKTDHPHLKIVLYHLPQYTGVPITLKIIESLYTEFPNQVVGIKESEGNLAFTKEILSTFPNFNVLVGNESQISQAVIFGAIGAISGIANALPELICSFYQYGKDQNKTDNNKSIQNILTVLKSYPIFPAIKALVRMQKDSSSWQRMRPPLMSLNEEQAHSLFLRIASFASL